ncbi:MAG: ribose-phosphate diphosphokinase [Candidatus Shapirobacteria bacterium]|nr:ribose-phosphate diphosphokinase [Candidatus Shapirobacteria bacterium]MDD3002753.1 ribose-phosphate diphosphokinase [Candidatus Shapirobacteria bacterium]MDD4383479.1 ribose-phosphate diphosphokinase [Candidatus Shapirobacteria bacterium]
MIKFKNRSEAAKQLVKLLDKFKNTDAVVLGIPRGGAITANIIAKELSLPFGIVIVRKIGHPNNPEYGIAAISESGMLVKNKKEAESIDRTWFVKEAEKQLLETKKRRIKYGGKRPQIRIEGKTVILVDDGLATGLTMAAAIKEVKLAKPEKIVIAVPISPRDTVNKLKEEVDEIIACSVPLLFEGAVGAYYEDFPQIEDKEVVEIMTKNRPLIFCMPDFKELGQEIFKFSNFEQGKYELIRFPNQEFQVLIHSKVKNLPAVFIGTTAPPHDQMWEFFLVCHTLRKEGVKKILAILPYLAYMRHDQNNPKEDLATSLMAKFFENAGVTELYTVDIHSEDATNFFKIPITSISPITLFAQKIKELNFEPSIIVAPDDGAIKRAGALKKELNVHNELVVFAKQRHCGSGPVSLLCDGKITGAKAIVIDDILDTGQTLINCVKKLHENGVKEVLVVVTHGIFSEKKWQQLFDYGVTKIITTDSIPSVKEKSSDKIIVIPISSLLIGMWK